jgi:hypothetical protein
MRSLYFLRDLVKQLVNKPQVKRRVSRGTNRKFRVDASGQTGHRSRALFPRS